MYVRFGEVPRVFVFLLAFVLESNVKFKPVETFGVTTTATSVNLRCPEYNVVHFSPACTVVVVVVLLHDKFLVFSHKWGSEQSLVYLA